MTSRRKVQAEIEQLQARLEAARENAARDSAGRSELTRKIDELGRQIASLRADLENNAAERSR